MKTAQSVMLAIHGKRTDTVDLKAPLLSYVRSTYSDREADDAADDITMVQQLRADIAIAHTGGNPSVRDSHAKYLRCLTAIETRFPISKEKGHAQVTFTWYDAFQPKRKTSQSNIHFEKASVLFNLASILSQIALASDRTTGDGLKQACQIFQEASGMFAYLRENECNKVDSPRPMDLSTECVSLLEKLMLAQAQECVFHKAVIDKKTPSLLARLAKQQCIMYSEVERLFASQALASYFDKSWLAHAQMKASVYDVETLVQSGKAFNAEQKCNCEIAALQEAFKRLQATKTIAKGISAEMKESVDKMQESIQFALNKAEKDNGTIYLQRVPPFIDLPQVQAACLVKAVAPTNLEVGQEVLFSGLVPESSAKALSKYTEIVDSTTRALLDKLAAATDDARIRLKSLELPDILEALDARTSAALPDAVHRELDDVQSVGGQAHLKEILAEIGQIREGLDQDLFQVQAELDGDAQQDAEAKAKYGDLWRVAPATTVAKPYWDKIAVYRSSLQKAADSDKHIISRLQSMEGAFADLTIDAAMTKMPRLQAPMVSVGPEDPAVVVATLRRNLELLQTLASERAAMEEAVKEMKKKDNILPKLMSTTPQGHDALFAAEIRKYDSLQQDAARNLEQQEKTMAEVERDNRVFVQVFDVPGWRSSCDASAQGIRESVKAFRELLNHLSEGLRFYIGTSEVVHKTLLEARDFVFTRGVQREELKQEWERRKQQEEGDKLSRQMAMASMHPGSGAYPAPPAPAGYSFPPPATPPSQYQQSVSPPVHAAAASSVSPPPPPEPSRPLPPPPQQYYQQPQQQYSPPQQQHQQAVPQYNVQTNLDPYGHAQQHQQYAPPQQYQQGAYGVMPPAQHQYAPQHQYAAHQPPQYVPPPPYGQAPAQPYYGQQYGSGYQ